MIANGQKLYRNRTFWVWVWCRGFWVVGAGGKGWGARENGWQWVPVWESMYLGAGGKGWEWTAGRCLDENIYLGQGLGDWKQGLDSSKVLG